MNQKTIITDGTFKSYDDINIYWKKYKASADEKASVLFIHGVLDHSGIYDYLGEELTNEGISVYALDIRGFGRSEGNRGHVEDHQDWVNDLSVFHNDIVKPQQESPLFLLTVSMGSIIAINYLNENPHGISGIILSEMGMKYSPFVEVSSRLAGFVSSFLPMLRVKTALIPPILTPADEPKSKSFFDPYMDNIITAKLGSEMYKAFKYSLDKVKEINLPILYQYGSKDMVFSKHKELFDMIGSKDKTIIEYKGYKHDIYKEKKEKRRVVIKDLTGWVNRQI
jgi:alpha-beta hydrolase superfamily lysophospholipase